MTPIPSPAGAFPLYVNGLRYAGFVDRLAALGAAHNLVGPPNERGVPLWSGYRVVAHSHWVHIVPAVISLPIPVYLRDHDRRP